MAENTPQPMPPETTRDWIFDLDNTLYHPRHNLFDLIDERMGRFMRERLGLQHAPAFELQKRYLREHGTTLKGLMDNHAIAPDEFLEYVHDISLAGLPPDPDLTRAIERLPGRKIVYTNGSRKHAERVLARIGCEREFSAIVDIAAAGYRPKPDIAPCRDLCRAFDLIPSRTVMIDDLARNLEPAALLGMTTVWLRHADNPDSAEPPAGRHIQHTIGDLGAWLAGLT